MQRWTKNPRTLRLNQAKEQVEHLEQLAGGLEAEKQTQVALLQHDFKEFCETVFGFTPFRYQMDLAELFEKNQFTAVRWSRQTGKSFSVFALILKYALEHPDSYIAIVGPSWRQTKLNIRRIGGFCRKLPVQQGLHVQKTRISLPNGSMIEAFIIAALATGGFREGTFCKLKYRHVKEDLEANRIPIHIHIEAEITKGKYHDYDTFLNAEASYLLKIYIADRRLGSRYTSRRNY